MSITSFTTVPEERKVNIVRSYSYQDKNPIGSVYNSYHDKEFIFENLTRFLFLLESLMDSVDYPQAAVCDRRFTSEVSKTAQNSNIRELRPTKMKKAIATFQVKILFRQGASWQGKLSWVEGKKECNFRSALELVKLMDDVLSTKTPSYTTPALLAGG